MLLPLLSLALLLLVNQGTNGQSCSQPVGMCSNGICPTGYSCEGLTYCCPTCSGAVPTVGGMCPTGYTLQGSSICCPNQTCTSGIVNGGCVNGMCATGYTCGQGNLCCKNSSCADQNSNCQQWAKNGFCTNPFYTPDDKKMCTKTCGLC